MRYVSRKSCVALLLALLVSHAALSAHAATHYAADLIDCGICTAHGDSSAVVRANIDLPPAPIGASSSTPFLPAIRATLSVLPFRPRGPPGTD